MATVTHHVRAPQGVGWLRPLHGNWPNAACGLLQREAQIVRVLVAEVRGSAPREPGVCMLVTGCDIEGTIGGGHLEWQAIAAARALLDGDQRCSPVQIQRLVLGTQLGQCCGGVVQLWLERLNRADLPVLKQMARVIRDGREVIVESQLDGTCINRRLVRRGRPEQPAFAPSRVHLQEAANGSTILLEQIGSETSPLWIYGAGHVGQALVRMLAELPFEVTWIDSRAGVMPAALPQNVRPLHTSAPVEMVMTAPHAARHLVMTHDHAMDFALCSEILRRGEFMWLGLIGSASKGARFRSRLRREGFDADMIDRLVCPIGVDGIASKSPAAIAVAVAAQLLQQLGTPNVSADVRGGKSSVPVAIDPVAGCSAGDCRTCRTPNGISA